MKLYLRSWDMVDMNTYALIADPSKLFEGDPPTEFMLPESKVVKGVLVTSERAVTEKNKDYDIQLDRWMKLHGYAPVEELKAPKETAK